MEPAELERAVEAGTAAASALGLDVDDAVVLHNSNRIAVRLTPCDALARIAPLAFQAEHDDFEVRVGSLLAEVGAPVAEPDPRVDPRVHVRDGFAVTLWTYYEPDVTAEITPAEYADALARLHAGLRQVEVSAPHFTDRVAEAQRLLATRAETPELDDDDRELLSTVLTRLGAEISDRRPDHQLLHGEPHLGNLLRTRKGLLFIDLETCCWGPVEFDIAHGLFPSGVLDAEDVCAHYPGADIGAVEQVRILIWAMITTWRWRDGDELPDGRYWRIEGLNQLRAALASG